MAWRRKGYIIWTNTDLIHLRVYAAPGGYELKHESWTNPRDYTTDSPFAYLGIFNDIIILVISFSLATCKYFSYL